MYMDKKLGFNNGEKCIDEVAYTINDLNIMDYSDHFGSNINYFGISSNISYGEKDENTYEVF